MSSTHADPSLPESTDADAQRVATGARINRRGASATVILTAALLVSYAPSLQNLVGEWLTNPNLSHGFFVAPIALLILWQRRGRIDWTALRPDWRGFIPLAAIVLFRVALFEWNEKYAETATLPLAAASLVWIMGGIPLLRGSWPALAFLYLMMPLPPQVGTLLGGPLQTLATIGSAGLLQLAGMPVLTRGNIVFVGSEPLEVAQVCNGLSMLMTFVTLIVAAVILVPCPLWERFVMLLSAAPIALASNIIRIAVTGWCYHQFGREAGERFAHNLAGWGMVPLAVAFIYIELYVLSLLVIEEHGPTDAFVGGAHAWGRNPRPAAPR